MNNLNEILQKSTIAVVGVSKSKHKFGNVIFTKLVENKSIVYAVNPNIDTIAGFPCVKEINDLVNIPELVIFVVRPAITLEILKKYYNRGIKFFWFQPGSDSTECIDFCKENGLNYVSGKCVLMYLEPVKGIHKFHRFINRLFNKY